MRPRIAIPVPHSSKPDYVARALPQYEHAVRAAGGEPVIIDVHGTSSQIAQAVKHCDGVLLPGSPADVDPEKYGAERHPKTAEADPLRDNTDELLLQDAFNMRKPVLGICYGLQSLNVWRTGSLEQDLTGEVNHYDGGDILDAHVVRLDPTSRLAAILRAAGALRGDGESLLPVNSSHHQSAELLGDGLRLVAWCVEDGVKEAVEGTSPEQFVLGVQWHPERTYDDDAASRAIFAAFINAAGSWHHWVASRQQDFESLGTR